MHKIYIFLIGLVLGAAVCFGTVYALVIGPSERTVEDYRAKQRELEATVAELGRSVGEREADIGRLEGVVDGLRRENSRATEDYRRLAEANRARQGIVETARKLVDGTDDALRKLELIIDAFEKLEQSIGH